MADVPLHRRPDADLELALRGLADDIAWPAAAALASGADLAATVRARIEAGPHMTARDRVNGPAWPRRWTWRPARRALVVAVIILLALAALAAAGGLGLPGLRLILGPGPVSPPPSVGAGPVSPPPSLEPGRSPAPGLPGGTLGLGRPVAVADLASSAAFPVVWPTDRAVGPPDAAYIDDFKGGQVTLVWASRPDLPDTLEPGVGLLVTAFQGAIDDGYFSKVINVKTTVQLSQVGDHRAFWLSGDPHFFFYTGPKGIVEDPRRWVGDALIWANGPITYRLETSLGRDRAVAIAESIP